MKFIMDKNKKKVKLVAETTAETAWASTLRASATRVNRGSEHYVVKAYNDWLKANGGEAAVAAKAASAAAGDLADLASTWGARTNAAPVPSWNEGARVAAAKAKADKARADARAREAYAIAYDAWNTALELERELAECADSMLKQPLGSLKQAANTISQLLGILGPDFRGVPWTGHARIVRMWLEDRDLA